MKLNVHRLDGSWPSSSAGSNFVEVISTNCMQQRCHSQANIDITKCKLKWGTKKIFYNDRPTYQSTSKQTYLGRKKTNDLAYIDMRLTNKFQHTTSTFHTDVFIRDTNIEIPIYVWSGTNTKYDIFSLFAVQSYMSWIYCDLSD